MTTLRPFRRARQHVASILVVSLGFSQVRSSALDFYLNGRSDGLTGPGSYSKWTYPGTGDTLVWGGGLASGALTVNATTPLGSNTLGVNGIKILNDADGTLTLQAHSSGAASQTLSIGSGGIDLLSAGQNLTINKTNTNTLAVSLAAAQAWNRC